MCCILLPQSVWQVIKTLYGCSKCLVSHHLRSLSDTMLADSIWLHCAGLMFVSAQDYTWSMLLTLSCAGHTLFLHTYKWCTVLTSIDLTALCRTHVCICTRLHMQYTADHFLCRTDIISAQVHMQYNSDQFLSECNVMHMHSCTYCAVMASKYLFDCAV